MHYVTDKQAALMRLSARNLRGKVW